MQADPGQGPGGDPGRPPQGEPRDGDPARVTGIPGVDEAVARLGDLADLPVSEHPAVFEQVHRRLAEALDGLDQPDGAAADRAWPGAGR